MMKKWIDRLKEAPTDWLEGEIERDKRKVAQMQRDIQTMERVLAERMEVKG